MYGLNRKFEDYIRKYAAKVELNVVEEEEHDNESCESKSSNEAWQFEIMEDTNQINFLTAAANISINSIDSNDSSEVVESIGSIDSEETNDSNDTNDSITVQSLPEDSCTTRKYLIKINSKNQTAPSAQKFFYYANNAKLSQDDLDRIDPKILNDNGWLNDNLMETLGSLLLKKINFYIMIGQTSYEICIQGRTNL